MVDINFLHEQDSLAPNAPQGEAAEPAYELIELLFFAYRAFIGDGDRMLARFGFGRAHHRALHFISRHPGITVAELLEILKITKQSLGRVLRELVETGFVIQREGQNDRRQRLLYLTESGEELRQRLMGPQMSRIRRAVALPEGSAAHLYRKVLYHMVSPANRAAVRDWIDRASLLGEQKDG